MKHKQNYLYITYLRLTTPTMVFVTASWKFVFLIAMKFWKISLFLTCEGRGQRNFSSPEAACRFEPVVQPACLVPGCSFDFCFGFPQHFQENSGRPPLSMFQLASSNSLLTHYLLSSFHPIRHYVIFAVEMTASISQSIIVDLMHAIRQNALQTGLQDCPDSCGCV